MKNKLLILISLACIASCTTNKQVTQQYKHSFEQVEGDPSNTLMHTLDMAYAYTFQLMKRNPVFKP